ncbi:spermidine/putrescine ABC transporter substrate-binding protein [Nocardioides ginsengisoli]|uniref:Spermidine/putrescine ABC transporter substrate-binding protein n=1 Tax=Nocardioides ginsengisoli TaxID=363868 RepID=A0ABW3VUB3_9ACTN
MRVLAPRAAVPRLSRRALLGGATVVGVGALAGCGRRSYAPTAAPDGSPESRLNIYSWGDYDDPENIKRFGKEHGYTVQLDAFASNEEMIAKLGTARGTSGYDIVVPTGSYVPQMVANGMLAPLDLSLIPNFANLEADAHSRTWDPHNRYVIAKTIGTTGFIYDRARIKRPMTSWADFVAAAGDEAKGAVSVLDDPFEVAGIYLASHGHDLNTTDRAVLAEARRFLVKDFAKRIRNFSSDPSQNIVQRDFALMQCYNGDARLGIGESDYEHWRFVYPTPTANLWMDTWAIAAGCQHPDNAHAWINFMLEPEVGYRDMDYNGYPTGLKGQRELAVRRDVDMVDLVFPPAEVMNRLTAGVLTEAQATLVDILNEVKAVAGA